MSTSGLFALEALIVVLLIALVWSRRRYRAAYVASHGTAPAARWLWERDLDSRVERFRAIHVAAVVASTLALTVLGVVLFKRM